MKYLIPFLVSILGLSTSAESQSSFSYGFEGWCAANDYAYEGEAHLHELANEPYGVRVTTQGFNFSAGEEGASCSFSNPTPVRDFDAILFDASCWSPYASAMGQDYLIPRRAMLQTANDDSTGSIRAFLIMPNNLVLTSVVEELRPCLRFKHSDMHSELGYEEGFYQPDVFSTSAQYVADLIYSGAVERDGKPLSELQGLEANVGESFLVGTTSCGMDCIYPFIFNIQNGREVKLGTSFYEQFDEENVSNFAFSMAHNDGRLLVSWRNRNSECILEEISIANSTTKSIQRHITPSGNFDFLPPTPLSCPAK